MRIDEAYMLAGEPEPAPEDHVNLSCSHCAGMWSDKAKSIHKLGDSIETVYTNYIGNVHCHLDVDGDKVVEWFTCPNGCATYGRSTIRYMTEADDLTPHREWELASLIVKHDKLSDQLKDVENELKNFGYNY